MSLGSMMKKAFNSIRFKKRKFDPQKVDIVEVKLPNLVMEYGNDAILHMVKEEISIYKALDYRIKTLETLERKTYHSFQIGIMLRFIQLDLEVKISEPRKIFPSFVFNYQKELLQSKVFDIVNDYNKNVNKDLAEVQLINDIEWTPMDATILLYYISIYKK